MTGAGVQRAAIGLVFDFLSKDHLTATETRLLQSALNIVNPKDIQISRINGSIGPETGRAIIGFLDHDGRRDFAPRVQDNIVLALSDSGLLDEYNDVIRHDSPLAHGAPVSQRSVGSLLTQERPLSEPEMRALQEKLNLEGYALGDVDGQLGRRTMREIIDYMKDHPEVMESPNINLLRRMTELRHQADQPYYDSREYLRDACRSSSGFINHVNDLIKNVDGLSTMNPAIFELQLLLKAGGYGVENPDGAPGPATDAAIKRFEQVHEGTALKNAWLSGTSTLDITRPENSPAVSLTSSLSMQVS
jgi:peptidoglycan hydrolase-like protein with peptidoglycan-binding domain